MNLVEIRLRYTCDCGKDVWIFTEDIGSSILMGIKRCWFCGKETAYEVSLLGKKPKVFYGEEELLNNPT